MMGYGITRKPKNMGQAIRFFCLECCGGHDEHTDPNGEVWPSYMPNGTVKDCPDMKCHLRPYRFGKRPSKEDQLPLRVIIGSQEADQRPRTRRKPANVSAEG